MLCKAGYLDPLELRDHPRDHPAITAKGVTQCQNLGDAFIFNRTIQSDYLIGLRIQSFRLVPPSRGRVWTYPRTLRASRS